MFYFQELACSADDVEPYFPAGAALTLNKASANSPKCKLKCCCPGHDTCSCIVGIICSTVTCPARQRASSLLPGRFSLTLRGQLPGPPPLAVMEVGCCFSAFLPTLASLVNWHHLLNGIAWVCKLLLQLSLIIKLDEWNWHDWSPVEQKHDRRRKD